MLLLETRSIGVPPASVGFQGSAQWAGKCTRRSNDIKTKMNIDMIMYALNSS